MCTDELIRRALAFHHLPALDPIMLALSVIGRRGLIWFVLGGALTLARPARLPGVWRMVLAIGLALLLTDQVVKPAVARVRPFTATMDVRVIDERPETFSFPSGHAAGAVAGAFALTRVWRGPRRWLWALAGGIAVSRVYVGVHYPLDVVGGAGLGLASGYFAVGGSRVYADDVA